MSPPGRRPRRSCWAEHGQPDVAGGLAALAEHLNDDGARDAGGHSDRNRCCPGQQCQADTCEGYVAETVTQQAEPALDDVRADGRCDQTGQQCCDECALHEGVRQDFDHGSTAPPSQLSVSSP